MAKKINRKKVEKTDYIHYLQKSQDFYDSMSLNLTHGKHSPAASAGIHCAILAAEACLIFLQGQKCSSTRHLDLVPLIEQLPMQEARKQAIHLRRVLEVKSVIEYTGDLYTADKARRITEHVERFFRWAISMLPKV